MRPTFSRMKPVEENMVIQPRGDYTGMVDVLCVECSWEATKHPLDVEFAFANHPCRLVSDSVSTSD